MNSQIWGVSSAGRAPALQAGGHRFDPGTLHQAIKNYELRITNYKCVIRREIDWSPMKMRFHWVSWEIQNAPWKLNIESIMMQLWEQQLREN